jgi:hypothetical protein
VAGNLTNYLENKLIDHFLGTTTYTKPTNIYVGLFTVTPGEAAGGTEVTGGSYARQIATFGAASSGSTTNSGNIDYTNMPAATTVAIGIFDALTSGNMLLYGALTTNKTTDAGDTLRIATGSLSVSID